MLGRVPSLKLLLLTIAALLVIQPIAFAYINISSCGIYDDPYTEYRINKTLTGIIHPTLPVCLLFNASNIIVDCQGKEIDGTGTFDGIGVFIGDPRDFFGGSSVITSNVTFKNCKISNYLNYVPVPGGPTPVGLWAYKTSNITIHNVELYSNNQSLMVYNANKCYLSSIKSYNNQQAGIEIQVANNIVIKNSVVYGNKQGISTGGITNLTVSNVTSRHNNDIGIQISNANRVLVANSTVYKNLNYGIGGGTVVNSAFDNNTVSFNKNIGLAFSNIIGSNITRNRILSNNNTISGFAQGVALISATGNIIAYNTVYNNSGHGIDIGSGSMITITHNNISHSTNGAGINVYDSDHSFIIGNNVSDINTIFGFGTGIGIFDSDYALLENNTVKGSTGFGIYLKGSRYCNVINNTATGNNGQGIMLEQGSKYNWIKYNSLFGGTNGIMLMNGSGHNEIAGNYIYGSQYNSIESRRAWSPGPGDLPTPNITIINNSIYNSGGNAIQLADSNGSMIADNIISKGTGPFSSGVVLDGSSRCLLDNNTISHFPLNAIFLRGVSTNNNISNSIFHSIAYGYTWAYAIQFLNSTPTSFPDANAFYNITVYNSSKYVAFSRDFSGYRPQNFTNLTLCNDSQLSTCIKFGFRQVTNAFLGYQGGGIDNLVVGADFVSMDGANWGASQFDGLANITIRANGCSNPSSFKIYRSPVVLPLSRPDILSTGIEFTPSYKQCVSSNRLMFTVASFSGYAAVNKYENSFNETISSPGRITLTKDYSQGNAQVAAIGIISSNVVLDLNGHKVRNGKVGIYVVPGLKNVTIMNGAIYNVTAGVIVNSSNTTLIRNMVIYNVSAGIYIDPSYNNTIINNTIFNGTAYGIYMEDSHNNTIINNRIYNISNTGVYSVRGSNNTYFNNTVYSATRGLNIENSIRDRLVLNNIFGTTDFNVRTEMSSRMLLDSNKIHSSSGNGILLINTKYSKTSNNQVYDISSVCIHVTADADHNVILGNNFTKCGGMLVSAWGINNLTVSNNNISLCSWGVMLVDTSQSRMSGNLVKSVSSAFVVNTSSYINFTGNRIINSTQGFYVYGRNAGPSSNLRIKDTEVRDSRIAVILLNKTQSVLIDNLTSENNTRAVDASYADRLTISNSRLTKHYDFAIDPVFNPLAIVRVINSTNIRVENTSFYKNSISSMLFWNTQSINIMRVNVTYSNASRAAFGDTGHIYLYPNVNYVNISYYNCSNGGLDAGGCFHNHGNVSDVRIDRSVFYNMSGGIEGRVPTYIPYGGYFAGYSTRFIVTNCSFRNLFTAMIIHAHNSTAIDNNVTDCFRGTGIRFSHHIMRNNKYVNNVESFGLAYDDGEEEYGPEAHDYFEHRIDTSNTIDGKPIYYYCSWAGNDKHNYVETNLNGGYYACIDCSNVLFENLTMKNVTHTLYIGFSNNITVRNVTGETTQGIKFFVTNNSRAYNNRFSSMPFIMSYLGILPPDYISVIRPYNLIWSKGINISNTISMYHLQCIYLAHSKGVKVYNVSCINSFVVPSVIFLNSSNNTLDDITLRNLSGKQSLYIFQSLGIPEAAIVSVYTSYNNTINNVNVSGVNLTNRAYYVSKWGSHTIVNDSWFNHTHISFSGGEILISNTTKPSAPLPVGSAHLLASPPQFLEIQNASPGARLNLTFYYTDAMIPPGHSQFDLRIWKYSKSASAWQRKGFITKQEVNPLAKTITAYNISNFSSPFGPLADTLQCVNLSDNSTWEGRLTNISNKYMIQLSVNAPIVLCRDTYRIPAFRNASGNGYLFYFNPNSGLNCNASTLIGSGNGTVAIIYTSSPPYSENITIRNCTFVNYGAGVEGRYPARNITIVDNVFKGFSDKGGKQPYGINFGEDANPHNKFSNIRIANNTFDGFRSTLDDGETMSAIVFGDSLGKSHSILIANNTIRNFTMSLPNPGASRLIGILLISGPSAGDLWNVTIEGNSINGLSATATDTLVYGIEDYGITNSSITGNRIYNLSGKSSAAGISSIASFRNNYTGNTISNISGHAGITAAIIPRKAVANQYMGNVIYNTSIGILLADGSNKTVIKNNRISGCNYSGIYAAVNYRNDISYNNITGTGTDIGIFLYGSSINNITWNRINGASSGIRVGSSYNNLSHNRILNSVNEGVYIGGTVAGTRLSHDIIQESGFFDLDVLDSPSPLLCSNTSLVNVTGSGGRRIVFVNTSSLIANGQYSELVLCGAKKANVTNVTVKGSDTLQNNGLFVLLSNQSRVNNTLSYGNFIGMYLYKTYDAEVKNTTISGNTYGIAIDASSRNRIHRADVGESQITLFFNGDSDWNNITDTRLHHSMMGSPLPSMLLTSGAGVPEFNRLVNLSMYAMSNYIGYPGVLANSNNFTNLSLCIDESAAGCIKWNFINATYLSVEAGRNILLGRDFVSLNSSDAGVRQLNRSAIITINTSACGAESGVGVLKAGGFPQSKAQILTTGSEYLPSYKSCVTPTTMRFSVDSFSGYTESPPYTIITLVDRAQKTSFYNSGEPYNLTVRVKYYNGTGVPNAEVRLYEYNGYLPFALPQYTVSNVSNYVYAKSHTDTRGNISLTVVPTGAAEVISENVGAYNVTVRVYKGNVHKGTVVMSVMRRNLPYANTTAVSVPNRGNVGYFNDDVYRVYSRVKEWLALGGSGGGQKLSMTVYTNGTVIGNAQPLMAGKPYGLNVTVLNHITLLPVPNARVQVTEQDGLPPLALPQYTSTNVSNIGVGYTNTTSSGSALITFIPTGNPNLEPSPLPEQYNASLQVYVSGAKIADVPLNVTSRSLSYAPSGPTQPVYNQGNVGSFNDKVYVIYSRILQWLSNN